MKAKMKSRILSLILLAALLLACGCRQTSGTPSTEGTQPDSTTPDATQPSFEITPDPDMVYIKYEYNICEGFLLDERYDLNRNITGTGELGVNDLMEGYRLVESLEGYEVLLDVFEWQTAQYDGEVVHITETFRSEELALDRAFFEENSLLVLDLCVLRAMRTRGEAVVTSLEDREITIDFYYGADISSTAANAGVLYMIAIPDPIPKLNYTSVDINWIRVADWTNYYNPNPLPLE